MYSIRCSSSLSFLSQTLEEELLGLRHVNETLQAEVQQLRAEALEAAKSLTARDESAMGVLTEGADLGMTAKSTKRKKSRRSSALFASSTCEEAGLGDTLPKGGRGLLGKAFTPVKEQEGEWDDELQQENIENIHSNILLPSPQHHHKARFTQQQEQLNDDDFFGLGVAGGDMEGDGVEGGFDNGGWGDDFPADGSGVEGFDD